MSFKSRATLHRAATATAGWETMTPPMANHHQRRPISSSTLPGHESLSGELSWWDDIIIYNDDKSDDEDESR